MTKQNKPKCDCGHPWSMRETAHGDWYCDYCGRRSFTKPAEQKPVSLSLSAERETLGEKKKTVIITITRTMTYETEVRMTKKEYDKLKEDNDVDADGDAYHINDAPFILDMHMGRASSEPDDYDDDLSVSSEWDEEGESE